MERIIRNSRPLVQFNSTNNLIIKSQHGFERGRSTDTALLQFHDYVTYNIDNSRIVDAVFFYFSKAFDKVPHNVLIQRLKERDIRGNLLD